jgi:hypothetical protein
VLMRSVLLFVTDPLFNSLGGMVRGCVLDEIPSFVHDRPTHFATNWRLEEAVNVDEIVSVHDRPTLHPIGGYRCWWNWSVHERPSLQQIGGSAHI